MHRLFLSAISCLLLQGSAGASLIGDSVSGCFSNAGCSQGASGSFGSSSAVASEASVEFSGSESGLDVEADFLTSGGEDVIRIRFSNIDPGSPPGSLPAGWELAFFDLDGAGGDLVVTGVAIDTSYQFAQIDSTYDPSTCSGEPVCENLVNLTNATAKAAAAPSVQSLSATTNGLSLVLDALPANGFGGPWFDLIVRTTVVPEPGTGTLVALGLVVLTTRPRGRRHAPHPTRR